MGIGAPLVADAAFGAVAGNEDGVVAQGPELLADAAQELGMVAAREVGAPDAACKEDVAHKGALQIGTVKNDVARGVAWAVVHGEAVAAEGDGVAARGVVAEPACGRECLAGRKAEHGALLGQCVNPVLVGRMRADDGQLQAAGEFGCCAGVVDVGVGEPDLLERDGARLTGGQQGLEVASGVNDSACAAGVVPDDGAVLREGGDGQGDVVQHGSECLVLMTRQRCIVASLLVCTD